MICSSVNFDLFMSGPLLGPDSSSRWRSYRGSRQRSRADSMRIGNILTGAGWIKEVKFKGGPYKDTTRYVRPGHQNLG